MNKKSAFIATVKSLKRMALETVNNSSNVILVESNL
jgi:hypothetical protein